MLLNGNLPHDQRVKRSVQALAELGYQIHLICLATGSTEYQFSTPGVSISYVQQHFGSGPSRFMESIMRMAKQVRSTESYDLIHAHDLHMAVAAVIGRANAEIPIIYDSHEWWTHSKGVGNRTWARMTWGLMERWLVEQPNVHIITVNKAIARLFTNTYRLKNRPVVLRNISADIPPQGDTPSYLTSIQHQLTEWQQNSKLILAYSGVVRSGRSLRQAIQILGQNKDLCLLMMGNGNLLNRLIKDVKAHNCQERVIFTGMLPYPEMMTLLSYADVGWCLIEPVSLSYRLSLPNKIFDYLKADLSVLATNLPVMEQTFGEHSLLEWVKSPSEIHSVLTRLKLLKDDKLSNTTFNQDDKPLNWNQEKQKLIELYQRLFEASL